MTWTPGPIVTRRRLGGELKRLRESRGYKLEEVARSLECSPSKVSRLENGKGIPRTRDIRDLLDLYEVSDDATRTLLLDWSKTGQARMWWQDYSDVLPPVMATYVELEWDAYRITAYEPYVVHGLLQTEDYAREVLKVFLSAATSDQAIERLVDVRMRRQRALHSDHGLTFECVLDESTLHRVVGSPSVQRAQVERLIAIAEAEHVDVRIRPLSARLVPSGLDSFAKLQYDGFADDMIYIESPGTVGELVDDPVGLAERSADLELLRAGALSEQASVPLMKEAVRRLNML
ncbi:helix-turn-helix transcriptional regulator [Actinomycetospora chlora]|uniref:Helix-turn-helix transcriptional regulator n=2 Tax=Actinomycetospora chlora TaxID=663608 RepID=A0ABP9BXJ0_9PSEU